MNVNLTDQPGFTIQVNSTLVTKGNYVSRQFPDYEHFQVNIPIFYQHSLRIASLGLSD